MLRRICVFCGSMSGTREAYRAAARETGRLLAERGVTLVYGGGRIGLMGILADAALARGGDVVGVIPEHLVRKEVAHNGLADLRTVSSMHERKALMADLSDAFIALPGGYGTLDEFCEILSWSQLGLHQKPCGILNVDGYYDGLLGLFDHAVREGFLQAEHRALVVVDEHPGRLLQRLEEAPLPAVEKWIDRQTR
ncbi:MAG: TIGR00730 family Rossman fold protein [Vicinamibacterales bacterium]